MFIRVTHKSLLSITVDYSQIRTVGKLSVYSEVLSPFNPASVPNVVLIHNLAFTMSPLPIVVIVFEIYLMDAVLLAQNCELNENSMQTAAAEENEKNL